MAKILIVDDEASIRKTLREILTFRKYEIDEAKNGLEALAKIKQDKFDLIILDIKMPKLDGLDTLERIQELNADLPVIMISGHANIDTAVEAVKNGAYDFISKPPDLNRMLITIKNALEKSDLVHETKTLKKKTKKGITVQKLVGESEGINKIKETIDKVSPTEARVLITGDNGTGKELVAQWIHCKSKRAEKPWVEVNCAAIPADLIESELFGHEKGAFTSAVKQRIGKFELADGGTIFLDEVGDMSLSAQAKVLRALQENKITRVGGDKEIKVNVRVIAATNKNLMEEIKKGKFREDLYHRLAVIIVQVPPLSERTVDIPILIDHFNEKICSEYGIAKKKINPSAVKTLVDFKWTGNIRELRNVVERLIIMSDDKISKSDVNKHVHPQQGRNSRFADVFKSFETLKEVHNYIEKEYKSYRSLTE